MKITYIAAIIESVYYNGAVKVNDKKLEIEDFTQMAIAANGTVMRAMWYEEMRGGNPSLYFAGAIETEKYSIEKKGRYRVIDFGERSYMKLPYANGILSIVPAGGDCDDCEDYDNEGVFVKGQPGMEYGFGNEEMMDDLGEAFYIPHGNGVRLFGFNDAEFADVDLLRNDEHMDIPEDAAWKILNLVLGDVLKVVGFPVDTTNDGNPNVTQIKKALSQPVQI